MMAARCRGAAAVRARWTARALAGAFLDLALAWACLCLAALASAAARLLPVPCTCARPHLPCLLAFLATYPSRALDSLHASLRFHFPFASTAPAPSSDYNQQEDEAGRREEEVEEAVGGDLRRELQEARAELQRELDKERSAAASAAEEAMAMILRLQKDKSVLEIEARQQRRTADERCAFYEDEVEELRDIILLREREARALRKEVDAYRRLLGLAPEDDEDDEEMVTPHSILLEGEPSSSKSVDTNLGNDRIVQLGIDSVFSFKTPFFQSELVPPVLADHGKGGNDDSIAVQTPGEVPVVQSKLQGESCEDDGTETVEILPLSARSLGYDQGGDFRVDAAAGTEATEEQAPDEFQEVDCGNIDKTSHDHTGSDNDAHIYDVHVVDDICLSTEVKGLIGRSLSEATIQAERLQTRAAADDVLGKSLNVIKGAENKIRLAASERRQSLQLQILEDIANQLQEIKDAAEAERHLYCASPKGSKKN